MSKHANRKNIPVYSGLLLYFPEALKMVSKVSLQGQKQHKLKKLYWDRNKSKDHLDALTRHLIDADKIDNDKLPHLAKVAWRALAALEEYLEKHKK